MRVKKATMGRYDGRERIGEDLNKLKEDVLKRGDNQDEGDGKYSVVDT